MKEQLKQEKLNQILPILKGMKIDNIKKLLLEIKDSIEKDLIFS